MNDIRAGKAGLVPPHLRDGHYSGAAKLGNAQGYRLHFIGLESSVPVARGRSAKVLEILQ